MSAFNANFKNMLLYLGRASINEKDCPLTSHILSELISYMFDNTEIASTLKKRFIDECKRIDKKYQENSMPSASYKDALLNRDRSLFVHIDLFPEHISKKYPKHISWFSMFLSNRMKHEHMEYIWQYIDKLSRQSGVME